jgi:hypothetical protein
MIFCNITILRPMKQEACFMPWWRSEVVIVSANGAEDRGFESRQGVRFLCRTLNTAKLLSVT